MNFATKRLAAWLIKSFQKICVERAATKTSKLINEIVCYNQGAYIQYAYLAGELHKQYKIKINNNEPAEQEQESLRKHLESGLRQVVLENLKQAVNIYSSFKGRDHLPKIRAGLKVHEYNETRKEQYVTTLWGTPPYYDNNRCPINENTASKKIHEHGTKYCGPDIPTLIVNGAYQNPRIDPVKVKEYMSFSKKFKRVMTSYKAFGANAYEDLDWCKCWTSDINNTEKNEMPTEGTCYKSTLVIPLTLKYNTLDANFIKVIKEKGTRTRFFCPDELDINDPGQHRYIYGYFCLDHVLPNFFDDDFDVHCGYIFADIISLFLYTQLTYTKLSYSYMNVKS